MNRRSFLKGFTALVSLPVLPTIPLDNLESQYLDNLLEYNHLARSRLWNKAIKEILLDELNSMKFITIIEEE